jgi:predicted ATPase/DNA-binding SARP family transcriptional activator
LPSSTVITDGDTLQLNPRSVSVDIWQLREIAFHQSNCEVSVEELGRVSALCAGEFLEGFTLRDCREFDAWQLAAGEEIRRQMSVVLTRLVRLQVTAGEYEQAIAAALRLVALDPLEEASHRMVIEVYARCGKWAAAASQFEQCRSLLADELGEDPSAETVRLMGIVRDHGIPLGNESSLFPRGKSYQRPPVLSTRFFGRSREIDEIQRLICTGNRVTTVTGAAGIGKTRLAIESVRDLDYVLPEGVVFVDLRTIDTASEVPRLVAQSIGLHQPVDSNADVIATLANQLDHRGVLLLLDNFEHVISAAGIVGELLRETKTVQVLVTSREPLNIQGERQIRLPPLGVSPEETLRAVAGSPAPQLFEDRARTHLHGFAIDHANYRSVRAICSALDGVPLAIELAVPLLEIYALDELPGRLATSLGYLTHGKRDDDPCHRTLETAISWSYDLLSRNEQTVLLKLSVFAAAFDLQAAEAVCGDGSRYNLSDTVHSLFDKSFILLAEEAPTKRFGLLQATRQFVIKRRKTLPSLDEVMSRHAIYYYTLALRTEDELHSPDQVTWLNRIQADHPNILASLSYMRDHHRTLQALEMAVALSWFWYQRGHLSLARRWLAQLIDLCNDAPPDLLARALHSLGWFTFLNGEWQEARTLYSSSLDISRRIGDRIAESYALSDLGVVERWLGNLSQGDVFAETAVQVARASGIQAVLAHALIWAYATTGGVFRDCHPEQELLEARRLAIATGDLWLHAHSYNGLGDLYCEQGEYAAARTAYETALQMFDELGDRVLAAWTLEGLGRVEMGCRNMTAALRHTVQALCLFDELGDELNVGLKMARIAEILHALEPDTGCAELAGAAAVMIGRNRRDELYRAPQIEEAFHYISSFEDTFPAEWLSGQSMCRADAVNQVRDLVAHHSQSASL